MARDRWKLEAAALLVGLAAMLAALTLLVPEQIRRDPMFRLPLMLTLLVVMPQWGTVRKVAAGRKAGADPGARRHLLGDLLHHLFRESSYRFVNGWAAGSLVVCAVLRWLVPGDWATGWGLLSLLVTFAILGARSGAWRKGTRVPAPAPVAAKLEWAAGARSREVATAAELRDLLWQLHHEAAGRPTSADLVLPGAPRAVIGLGEPDSMVLTLPDGAPPQVAVAGPDGPTGVPVAYTEDREPVFPPSSEIPVEVAIEVLCAYFTVGELPRPNRAAAQGTGRGMVRPRSAAEVPRGAGTPDGAGAARPVPGDGETAVSVALTACLVLAVGFIGLCVLVPDLLGEDRGLKLAGLVLLVGLGPQVIRYVMGRWRGVPKRQGRLLPYLFRVSPFWMLNWWLAITLAIGALLWPLVTAEWVEVWFSMALFCVFALDTTVVGRSGRPRRKVSPAAGDRAAAEVSHDG